MRRVVLVGALALAVGCGGGSVSAPLEGASSEQTGDSDASAGDDFQQAPADAEIPVGDTGPACPAPIVHEATGTTRALHAGAKLAPLLAQSAPGDRVLVDDADFAFEQITAVFASDVFIEAASGATPSFAGLKFIASAHLVMRGLSFTDTLTLEGSHDMLLEGIAIDLGTQDKSALALDGQHASGATHHITVSGSSIHGGARTVFFLGSFAPSQAWNHDIIFKHSDFACGSHNCFQLSGARDTQIVDNLFHDPLNTAVLTAGATRITIARNRMIGNASVSATAIQIATPGEWDPYTGNENMISSDVVIADNLIVGWGGPGISLHAATRVSIVNNTIDTVHGLSTWRRVPHDTDGNVILTGNTEVRLWNNIMTTIELDTGDPRPVYETNNLVRTGGGGDHLITSDPRFASTTDYVLAGDSPAIDAGLTITDTPMVDLLGYSRTGAVDLGAMELNGTAPTCP